VTFELTNECSAQKFYLDILTAAGFGNFGFETKLETNFIFFVCVCGTDARRQVILHFLVF
jgi:hypothetical protein